MNIRASGLFILGMLQDTLSRIGDDAYVTASDMLSGATTGQHVRHILEFFTCLNAGYLSSVVNYDRRAHDHTLEINRALALETIITLKNFLQQVSEDKALDLETAMDPVHDDWVRVPSSFSRELAYTIDHAIHHMAIIKPAIRQLAPGLRLDPAFGVAFSTLRHQSAIHSEQENA